MIDSLGWFVAAFVTVAALIYGWIRKARSAVVTMPPSARDSRGIEEAREHVVEAVEANIEGLWDDLESDDPSGAITEAANEARRNR